MTPGFVAFVSVLVVAQLFLPKKVAFLPLVVGACHLGNAEIVGELTTVRLLLAVGMFRAVLAGNVRFSLANALDRSFGVFGVVAILSAVGHSAAEFNPWVARAGLVFNVLGTYLYGRAYLPDLASFYRYVLVLPFVLIPLASSLLVEKTAQRNAYAFLGSGSFVPMERDGKIRAQGPFRHAILAGCAGATSLPLMIALWQRRKRLLAVLGVVASMTIVICCASSGPLAAVFVTLLALVLWRWRSRINLFIWGCVAFAAFYWVVAGRGPWYIMASLDLVGGSTGWHRAKLFDQGYKYLSEWWFLGTDYTRHWMSTGVSWSPNHVDLTNYYLHLGVTGGILLPGSLLFMIVWCLRSLLKGMVVLRRTDDENEFSLWCLAAVICTHAVSFVSISYFDQMYVFFYLSLALVPGVLEYVSNLSIGRTSADAAVVVDAASS